MRKMRWTVGTVASMAVICGLLFAVGDRIGNWIDHKIDDRTELMARQHQWIIDALIRIAHHDHVELSPAPTDPNHATYKDLSCPDPGSGIIASDCP